MSQFEVQNSHRVRRKVEPLHTFSVFGRFTNHFFYYQVRRKITLYRASKIVKRRLPIF